MVSLKMKLRKPTFNIRGNKGKKENTAQVAEEPTVQITPVENDPIMEDREDGNNESNATPSPSVEDERSEIDDERSPVDDDNDAEGVVQPVDDDSVMTEPTNDGTNAGADDALSTVKEEPSKEEAEEKAEDESHAKDATATTQSMVEDVTVDDTATTTLQDTSIASPSHTPAFCGCFGP